MANCVICGKECTGECCGGACRAKKSRRTERTRTVEAHAGKQTKLDDWQEQVNALPIGVVHPTCRPDDTEPNGPDWWNRPSYAKVIETLLLYTIAELKAAGIWIPSWKYKQATEIAT